MKVKMTVAAVTVMALMLGLPAFAAADVIKVRPGESIQDAIDEASPGDTIKIKAGTFEENVVVTKDDLTIEGAGHDRTRIVPGTPAAPTCPEAVLFGVVAGICAQGVADVHITELAVDRFTGPGVLLFGTSGARVDEVQANDNGEYGLAAFESTGVRFVENTTARNGEAGVYVGDSPDAQAKIAHNTAYDNVGFGVFIRDASFGEVKHNRTFGNCVGIILLNTGAGVGNWIVGGNRAVDNSRACPGGGDEPGLSGIGIGVAGAHDIDVVGNVVLHNKPSGVTDVSGGIVLISLGPEALNANVRVKDNTAIDNDPFDLLWDGQGSGIEFKGNRCKTSEPDGLCVKGRGDHHGDHDDDDDHRGDHKGDRGRRHHRHGDDNGRHKSKNRHKNKHNRHSNKHNQHSNKHNQHDDD